MSSARLEVIKDDTDTPAYMSRSMPAALEGLLTQTALDDFCHKLDALFVLTHAECKRVTNLANWMIIALYFYVLFCIPTMYMIEWCYKIGTFILIAVDIGIIWMMTQPGAGTKSFKEILRLIRFECDEMTRRTPFVSFHAAVGTIMHIDIKHIDVSISVSETSSGVASGSNAIVECTIDSKIADSSDNHHPVVYAQAVTSPTTINDSYQQLNDVQVV
jgi:hypothetical protein